MKETKVTLDQWLQAAATMIDRVALPDETKPIIAWLCQYFSEDPEFEKQKPDWLLTDRPSLKKGIMLIGPNGVGKTLTLEVFHRMAQFGLLKRYFGMTDGRQVASDIARNGFEAISRYTSADKLFNELGSELPAKYYGNSIDAMYEVIFEREKLFNTKLQKTHITTNMNAEQLADRYDTAIFSRLRGMCNIIEFGAIESQTTGYDLRGFSQRINTHINYADLQYRWPDYFGIINDIINGDYTADALPIMIDEVLHRRDAVKCLYPGVFGPALDEVNKFIKENRHPENYLKYARTETEKPPQSNPETGNDSATGGGLGDIAKRIVDQLKNPNPDNPGN